MIFRYLINCYVLPAENAVVKNPIAALKKKHSGFCTSVFWPLVAGQDPLPRQKNHSSMGQTRLFLKRRNRLRNRYTVTTNHLLLAIHRRRATSLLPFSQPISQFADSHSQRDRQAGGRGVRRAHPAKVLRWKSAYGNFIPIGSPGPFLLLSKKTRFEPCSNSKWSAPGLSRELAANHR